MKFSVINKMLFHISIAALIFLTISGYIGYSVFKEIRNTHNEEKRQVQAYINDLKRIDIEELGLDKEIYGVKLELLYSLASYNSEDNTSSEVKENAFKKIITDYPKSYTSAKLIAEHALASARNEDLPETEKYYNMLKNYNFLNIITGKGLDAIPNIENDLARFYFRKGQKDELVQMTRNLENHPDSYVLISNLRGFSRPRLRPVSEAILKLKMLISELKNSTT